MLDLQELVAEAQMGAAAEQFWKSDIGRYVLGRLQQDINEAMGELMEVDPNDSEAVRTLQLKIAMAQTLPGYLADLISQGTQAEQVLDEASGP